MHGWLHDWLHRWPRGGQHGRLPRQREIYITRLLWLLRPEHVLHRRLLGLLLLRLLLLLLRLRLQDGPWWFLWDDSRRLHAASRACGGASPRRRPRRDHGAQHPGRRMLLVQE